MTRRSKKNNAQLDELQQLIAANGWADVPESFTSREGHLVSSDSEAWTIYTAEGKRALKFERVRHPFLKWALKRFLMIRTQAVSSIEGLNALRAIGMWVLARQDRFGIQQDDTQEDLRDRLISLMQEAIREARDNHRLWSLYRVVRWYIWCADNFPELGFSPEYANELDGIRIPGNPKGEAVRSSDPDAGPLDRLYELPLLRRVLDADDSGNWYHLRQKAALALSIAFGRNPANLAWLNESDLSVDLQDVEGLQPFYTLSIPRIKKRQRNTRDDFKIEPLDAPLAKHVQRLIEANQAIDATVMTDHGAVAVERPLFFVRRHADVREGRYGSVPVARAEAALRIGSATITQLLNDFVDRHNIISPLTNEPMVITTRRLRYTVATALVEEGASQAEVAEFLDHSDTQHVQVYFELKGKIVRHLDAAAQPKLAGLFGFFKGKVVSGDAEAVNGDRADKHLSWVNEANPKEQTEIGVCGESAICNLDPPYSCYVCPKFQPYRHADHEHVLDCLLKSRQERLQAYENARLGVQLDDVITAVSSVISVCKEKQGEAVDG